MPGKTAPNPPCAKRGNLARSALGNAQSCATHSVLRDSYSFDTTPYAPPLHKEVVQLLSAVFSRVLAQALRGSSLA